MRNKNSQRAVTLLLFTIAITACGIKKPAAPGQPAAPVTQWENINLTNAEIAVANDGVAKGLIAANNLGALETAYVAQVTQVQFNVAAWQKELTPLLASASTAQTNSARIQQLTSQLARAAAQLVASGNAGIKDKASAAQLTAAINSLNVMASSLVALLTQAGVIK